MVDIGRRPHRRSLVFQDVYVLIMEDIGRRLPSVLARTRANINMAIPRRLVVFNHSVHGKFKASFDGGSI